MNPQARITVICGHYGCGKTNLTLNLALDAAEQGETVTVADLDVVNPYFRSSEYGGLLVKPKDWDSPDRPGLCGNYPGYPHVAPGAVLLV